MNSDIVKDTEILLCNLTHDYHVISNNKMPLSVGVIAAFIKEKEPDLNVKLFKQISYLEGYLSGFSESKSEKLIIAFSNFVWNQSLNIEIARIIKMKFPKSLIVFGGPNFPMDEKAKEEFLNTNNEIDFYIPHEGEYAFFELIKLYLSCNFDISKTKYLKPKQCAFIENGNFVETESEARVKIIETPSPYTSGLMDTFFGKFVPLTQFTRGCPFRCAYCTEGGDYWKNVFRKDVKYVEDELEYIASRCDQNDELHLADSNFGMYAKDEMFADEIASTRLKHNWPNTIIVATGKNSQERVLRVSETLDGMIPLSVSVQSTDATVLKNVKRKNIKLDDIFSVGLSTKEKGTDSYADIILALPGDTYVAHIKTLEDVLKAGVDSLTPFQFMMLKGTNLETSSSREEYGMKTAFRVVPRCFGIYNFFGESFSSAEIEEICIENNTISFDEYLNARKLHLIINIFYNDKTYKEVFLLLSEFNISYYDFLIYITENLTKDLKNFLGEFIEETKNELFSSYSELDNFAKNIDNIKRYVNGEIGANLLFKYKLKAVSEHDSDLIKVLFDTLKLFLKERIVNISEIKLDNFFLELKELMSYQYSDILDTQKRKSKNFSFDFFKLGKNPLLDIIEENRSVNLSIRHDEKVSSLIDYNKKIHGMSLSGQTLILNSIGVSRCFREIYYGSDNVL